MDLLIAYLGLFAAAFIAATLLPAQSEGVLVALLLAGYVPWLLVLVASVGNVLGSTVNWWIGREVTRFADRRWFPVKPAALARAQLPKYEPRLHITYLAGLPTADLEARLRQLPPRSMVSQIAR